MENKIFEATIRRMVRPGLYRTHKVFLILADTIQEAEARFQSIRNREAHEGEPIMGQGDTVSYGVVEFEGDVYQVR